MTAAQAFVDYRHFAINQLPAEKRADWREALGGAADYIGANPWAQGALAGGALGGLTGIPSGHIMRNALYGAGIGGTIGGGKQILDYLAAQGGQQSAPPPSPMQPYQEAGQMSPWEKGELEDPYPTSPNPGSGAPPDYAQQMQQAFPGGNAGALATARSQSQRTDVGQQQMQRQFQEQSRHNLGAW